MSTQDTPLPDLAFAREWQTMVALLKRRGIDDPAVLEAFARVPRHDFVPAPLRARAYGDYPLPIAGGQTISQPYIVALMTQALDLASGDKVLEIGTGSGYQAAILAEMGMVIDTVEVIPELYEAARARLTAAGYRTIHCHLGDGYRGWPEQAPYIGIIVTAAPETLPQTLVDQLADGGRMVIPIGPKGLYQTLWKITKRGGQINREDLGGVAFVPFIHGPSQS